MHWHFKKTITDGLVVALDAANLKSFFGEQTTNLYTGDTNSFPKVGNGFGTYNTNQYNNNTLNIVCFDQSILEKNIIAKISTNTTLSLSIAAIFAV